MAASRRPRGTAGDSLETIPEDSPSQNQEFPFHPKCIFAAASPVILSRMQTWGGGCSLPFMGPGMDARRWASTNCVQIIAIKNYHLFSLCYVPGTMLRFFHILSHSIFMSAME